MRGRARVLRFGFVFEKYKNDHRGAEFAIIGEGVSPGFDFRDFKFVSASELARRNAACYDDTSSLVKPQPEDTFDHYYAQTPPQEYFTPPGSGNGVSRAPR